MVSLTINLIVLADFRTSPFAKIPVWDANVYWEWAQRIAAGDWIGNSVFHQAPLYPYFLSLSVLIFGKSLIPIYVIQSILSACSTVLVYQIATRVSGEKGAGFVAGLLFALYGMQVFYCTRILSECLSIFLLLLTTRLLLFETLSGKHVLLAGVLMGMLILARPHHLLVLPLLFVWLRMSGRGREMRCFLARSLYFSLPLMALVGSVTIRNYAVAHEFVLISTNGGENFYIGNHEKANGSYMPVEGISRDIEYQDEDVHALAEQKNGRRMKRSEVSRYWFRQGMSFILHHPEKYGRLAWAKLKYMFSGAERSTMYYRYFESAHITKRLKLPFVSFYLPFPLFGAGILVMLPRWRRSFPIFVFLFANMLNILIFFYDTRFMLLAMPFWIILGGVALWHLRGSVETFGIRGTLSRPAAIVLILTAGLSSLIYSYDARAKKPDWHMHMTLGEISLELNDLSAALKAYTQASYLNQNDWMPVFGISKVYFRQGHKEVAAQLYSEAFPNLNADFKRLILRDKDLAPVREYIQTRGASVGDSLPDPAVPVGLDNPHS